MKWLTILAAGSVIAACFFPWVVIEGKDMFFGGFESSNENYGKPGLFHVILCSLVILLVLWGKMWGVRIAFFISAFNIAWALRNYVLISACRGGECPDKQTALYVLLAGSLLTTCFLLLIKPAAAKAEDRP